MRRVALAGVAGVGLLLTVACPARGSTFPPIGDLSVVVIDNFEDPGSVANLVIDDEVFAVAETDTGLLEYNVIGGVRSASLSALEVQYSDQYAAMNINEASSGLCFMTSSSSLQYPGVGSLRYGGLVEGDALDLEWSASMEIVVDVDGFPAKSDDVMVQLWSQAGTPEEKSSDVSKLLTTSDSSLSFFLWEFTNLDPNDVDQIQVSFIIPGGQSLAIETIYAIPEPGTAVVLSVGLLGVLRRRLRR